MEQLNPGHSPVQTATSSSKLLYSTTAIRKQKMRPFISLLNYLHLQSCRSLRSSLLVVKPSLLCCPQKPSSFNLQYSCSCHAPHQAKAPSCCPGGRQEEKGFLRVPERFPAPASIVYHPISRWRSNWMENPIWFLHPWRHCIPTNRIATAPDQCRQDRGALVGQTVPSI